MGLLYRVADALRRRSAGDDTLASKAQGGHAYNCGASRFGTMREVLENLCRRAGTGSQVKSLAAWLVVPTMEVCSMLGLSPLGAYHSLMYGRSMYFDITKAQTELQWMPKYSNDDMFIESYCWYLQNRDRVLARSGDASRHRSAVKEGALRVLQMFL